MGVGHHPPLNNLLSYTYEAETSFLHAHSSAPPIKFKFCILNALDTIKIYYVSIKNPDANISPELP